VLTAAHCIDEGMVKAGYRVRLGATDISKNEGMNYKIDRIVRHSQYDEKTLPAPPPNMYSNDIALIHIVDDAKAGARDPARIHPIPLFDGKVTPGAEVTGTGWGKTEAVEGHAPSAVLMKVDLRAMDTETCKNRPTFGPERISAKVICASNPHRSTCQGDSGGALTFTNGAPTAFPASRVTPHWSRPRDLSAGARSEPHRDGSPRPCSVGHLAAWFDGTSRGARGALPRDHCAPRLTGST